MAKIDLKINCKHIPESENVKFGDGILPPHRGGHLGQNGSNLARIDPKKSSKNIPEFENVRFGDVNLPPHFGGHLSQGLKRVRHGQN